MDADLSHDPKYLPQLLEGLADADLVLGSRYIAGGGTENWSIARQWISRVGNLTARVGLGIKTRDATGGFRAYRRSTLEKLELHNLGLQGYAFQIELIYQVEQQGLQIEEIPIIFVERASGTSKMSKAIVLEAILHILKRRFEMVRNRRQRGGALEEHQSR
jgi:dolichol-phosphate mannosyltransferase